MDSRSFLWAVIVAIAVAAGCNKQEKESRYSAPGTVKGTEHATAVVPDTPDTGKEHGNAGAQKGGSANAGTAQPKAGVQRTP